MISVSARLLSFLEIHGEARAGPKLLASVGFHRSKGVGNCGQDALSKVSTDSTAQLRLLFWPMNPMCFFYLLHVSLP